MWIDANGCQSNFHQFKRTDTGILCFHSDDQECKECEYDLSVDSLEPHVAVPDLDEAERIRKVTRAA